MKNLVILIIVGLLFTSCKNETYTHEEVTAKKEDTMNVANLNATKSPISPPDKDYTGDYVDKYPNGIIRFSGFLDLESVMGNGLHFMITVSNGASVFMTMIKKIEYEEL